MATHGKPAPLNGDASYLPPADSTTSKNADVEQAGSDWPIDFGRLATDFNGIDCMSPPIGHIELQNI